MKNLTIIGIVNVMGWILAELGSLQHPDPAFALYRAEWICEVICKFGRHYFIQVIFNEIDALTPNRHAIHTYFTYPILNMGDFSALYGPLGCIDSTQKVKGNSLHAQRGIGKEE